MGLSTSLRAEAAGLGVKVSVVCPGFIQTPLIQTSEIKNEDQLGFDSRDSLLEMQPFKFYPVEKAAHDILKGLVRNKAIIVVTGHGKLFWVLYRIWPSLVIYLSIIVVKNLRKRFGNP